jgi:hypothetical protein
MYFRFSPERFARLLVCIGCLFASAATAVAAPVSVLPFGMETWKELGLSSSRPTVVVFSTTDCGHCPAVINSLAQEIRKSRAKVRLTVVVMDGAGQEKALLADRHYRHANLLYAFDGDGMVLRFKVNPEWRGLTPYVALIPAAGETRFHTGLPPADAVRAFLRP